MLESKLWYNKTDIKSVKGAKMVEFIKTCDYYPCKFNFGRFFMSIILSFFCWQKIGFPGLLFAGSGEYSPAWSGDGKNVGVNFSRGHE